MAYMTIKEFLPKDHFNLLTSELDNFYKNGVQSCSLIEKKKEVIKIDDLSSKTIELINMQGGDSVKNYVREITGWKGEIYSLLEIDNFGGYAPMHKMTSGGFLGSHVDHSFSNNGELIHVANSIFYATPHWEKDWQGETIFFNKSGYKEVSKVSPEANKLLIFTHDSESFHGVNRITCPDSITRTTFYMDYYIHKDDFLKFSQDFYKKNNEQFIHFKYLTMFLPIPMESGKLMWEALFKREFKGYLRNYLYYLNERSMIKNKNKKKSISITRLFLVSTIRIFELFNVFIKKVYRGG